MMRDAVIAIFGEYIPLADGGINYEWLAGVLLFSIAFYGLFRIGGALVKR